MHPEHPLPIEAKVRDFDALDRLELSCPHCRRQIGQESYDVHLEFR